MKDHDGNVFGIPAALHIFECFKVRISCTSMAILGKWQKVKAIMMTRKMTANRSSALRRLSLLCISTHEDSTALWLQKIKYQTTSTFKYLLYYTFGMFQALFQQVATLSFPTPEICMECCCHLNYIFSVDIYLTLEKPARKVAILAARLSKALWLRSRTSR